MRDRAIRTRAYAANRRAAIEGMIDVDPIRRLRAGHHGRVQLVRPGRKQDHQDTSNAGRYRQYRQQRLRPACARPAGDVCDDDSRSDLVGRHPVGPAYVTTADDADGADANASLHFG
jgi:hypothetical protein